MPHSELHKKQKTKNYAVLAIIVALMVLFFVITVVRLKTGAAL